MKKLDFPKIDRKRPALSHISSYIFPQLDKGLPQYNKSANALALCHPPSASFCSVLAGQWSSRIFTHDRYNILSDILIEFEVNLGIIIEKYAKT